MPKPEATKKHPPPTLTLVAFNCHNAPEKTLRDVVSRWDANGVDLIAFNEVWERKAALGRIADDLDLRHFQEPVRSRRGTIVYENGSTAVLVAPGVKVMRRRVIVLKRPWTVFLYNRRHDGRRLERLRISKGGQVYKVTVVHGPTNGPTGGNRFAYAEFLSAAVKAVRARKGITSVVVGDFNAKVSWLKPWAKTQGAVAVGHNVDAAVVKGGTVRRKTLGQFGSDHEAIEYTVRAS